VKHGDQHVALVPKFCICLINHITVSNLGSEFLPDFDLIPGDNAVCFQLVQRARCLWSR
jgi:hypothetical protein